MKNAKKFVFSIVCLFFIIETCKSEHLQYNDEKVLKISSDNNDNLPNQSFQNYSKFAFYNEKSDVKLKDKYKSLNDEEDQDCDNETINKFTDYEERCAFISKCDYNYINLLYISYCNLNGSLWIAIPVVLIFLFLSFYFLTSTTNKYLSDATSMIADSLNMSQNLAGITILAFGNGAPDFISSFVAMNSKTGFQFAIGGVIGTSLFITTVVFSFVIFFSPESIKVIPRCFIRDISFMIFSNIFLLLMSIAVGQMYWYTTQIFILIYVGYVIFVIIQEKSHKIHDDTSELSNQLVSESEEVEENKENDKFKFESKENDTNDIDNNKTKGKRFSKMKTEFPTKKGEGVILSSLHDDDYKSSSYLARPSSYSIIGRIQSSNLKIDTEQHEEENDNNNSKISKTRRKSDSLQHRNSLTEFHKKFYVDDIYYNYNMMKIKAKHQKQVEEDSESESEVNKLSIDEENKTESPSMKVKNRGCCHKFKKYFFMVLDFPFDLIRCVTIQPCSKDDWNYYIFTFSPFTVLISSLYITGQFPAVFNSTSALLITILVTLIIILIFAIWAKSRNIIEEFPLFSGFYTFVISLLLVYYSAQILVQCLDTLGILLNIPNYYFSMTFLAIANSVGDLAVNITLSEKGMGEMAIAGSIAGPLFNFLIGTGIAALKYTIQNGAIDFTLKTVNYVGAGLLIANLIRLLIQTHMEGYLLSKKWSYIGFGMYMIYFVYVHIDVFALSN